MSGHGFDVRCQPPPDDLLPAPAARLMDDHASFNRILTAASMESGHSYLDTFNASTRAVTNGAETALSDSVARTVACDRRRKGRR